MNRSFSGSTRIADPMSTPATVPMPPSTIAASRKAVEEDVLVRGDRHVLRGP